MSVGCWSHVVQRFWSFADAEIPRLSVWTSSVVELAVDTCCVTAQVDAGFSPQVTLLPSGLTLLVCTSDWRSLQCVLCRGAGKMLTAILARCRRCSLLLRVLRVLCLGQNHTDFLP
jgi:hypothetical protein